MASTVRVSLKARGFLVSIQVMMLICVMVMNSGYTCEGGRILYASEKEPGTALDEGSWNAP